VARPDSAIYLDVLYPFQDEVLSVTSPLKTDLYLSGGTAISRGYLHHRFSEDLDFFADDAPDFGLQTARLIQALEKDTRWSLTVAQRENRLIRLALQSPRVVMKVEMINDVPARVGTIRTHPILGSLDSPENLLANKITALLDRNEPKDLADIWGLCTKLGLSLVPAIEGAQGKAAGIFPPDLARALCSATQADWDAILWQEGPEAATFIADLIALGETLLGL
jgi:hypothetical protein